MYEKFDKFTTKLLNNVVVIILIFVIGFTITGRTLYNTIDFKYATDKDYEPLYQIQQSIINDFDTVYTFSNTDIDITDSNIIVYIYGDNCYLKTSFDKTKTYQNTKEIDNTNPIWLSVFTCILASMFGSVLFYLLILIIIFIIDRILLKASKFKIVKEKGRDIDH